MPDIKVRVGQQSAVKVVASAFGGSLTAENAQNAVNVIGGIASVTQIYNSGITTLGGNLFVAGISTLAANGGITTTGGDFYVGGDLYVKDDITFDELNARNANFTGITTASTLIVNGQTSSQYLNVTGVSTFSDNIGVGTADPTAPVQSSNTSILAVGILTAYKLYSGGGGVIIGDDITTRNFEATGISTFKGLVGIAKTTQSTSTSTGALVVTGGVGIGSNLYVGGNINGTGSADFATLNITGVSTSLRVETQNLNVSGIATLGGSLTEITGRVVGVGVSNILPFLYSSFSDLPSASTYHGAFAHVHERGKAFFAHSNNWWELVNVQLDGTVGTSTERYNIGPTNISSLNVSGISTFGSDVSIGGTLTYEDVTNVDSIGLITARTGVRITTGGLVISAGDANIQSQLNVTGISTLSSSGGITTTGGDLYVGGDLYISDDITFDEFNATNGNITGIMTAGTMNVTGTLTAGLIDGGSF